MSDCECIPLIHHNDLVEPNNTTTYPNTLNSTTSMYPNFTTIQLISETLETPSQSVLPTKSFNGKPYRLPDIGIFALK